MITVNVYNIDYDTVDMEGVERRSEIEPSRIPTEKTFEFDPIYLRLINFDDWVRSQVEDDWLVDRFDYQVISPVPHLPVHVECQARAVAGVPQFTHLAGKSFSYVTARFFR